MGVDIDDDGDDDDHGDEEDETEPCISTIEAARPTTTARSISKRTVKLGSGEDIQRNSNT